MADIHSPTYKRQSLIQYSGTINSRYYRHYVECFCGFVAAGETKRETQERFKAHKDFATTKAKAEAGK